MVDETPQRLWINGGGNPHYLFWVFSLSNLINSTIWALFLSNPIPNIFPFPSIIIVHNAHGIVDHFPLAKHLH